MPYAFFSGGMRVGLHSISETEIYKSFVSSFFDAVRGGGFIHFTQEPNVFCGKSQCCFLKNNNNKICVFIFTCL